MNITNFIYEFAALKPAKLAFIFPEEITFGGFVEEIERIATGLLNIGIRAGTKTIVLIKPGIDLFSVTFALFRLGAIPVLIDPGMGRKRMSKALEGVGADAFAGIPRAHLLRYISPRAFRSIKIWVSTGFRWFGVGSSLKKFCSSGQPVDAHLSAPEELSAIFFTSGSTGMPKGVCYNTRMLAAQIEYMKSHFKYTESETDLCTFPLIGFLTISHGISIVLADMDMKRPATLNPEKVIRNIQDHKSTHMFCSPMVLNRLAEYGINHSVVLDSMKRIMTAGAPVPPSVLKKMRKLLPSDAEIHTPYGATEALPVTDITDRELVDLYDRSDGFLEGICVGYPLEGIEVKILAIHDGPVGTLKEIGELNVGQIGEITLSGPNVTELYLDNDRANGLAKIRERGSERIWHRSGDLGRMDQVGRIWFYGRKSQRVVTHNITYFTIPVEAVFNQHPEVIRSALVGVEISDRKDKIPVICIESAKSKKRKIYLQEELRYMAKENHITIAVSDFLFRKNFPMDPRHNAKIYREELATWAQNKMRS